MSESSDNSSVTNGTGGSVPDPLQRLSSFKTPRDLSLGGPKPNKKVFTPNLNVSRNKNKSGLPTVTRDKRDHEREKRDRRNDRNKNNRNGPNVIKSSGVFSEGLGQTERRSTRASFGRDVDTAATLQKPTIRVKDVWKIDKELEQQKIDKVLGDGDYSDDEPSADNVGLDKDAPVKLPMSDGGWLHSKPKSLKIKQEVVVKAEPDEVDASTPPVGVKSKVEVKKESLEETDLVSLLRGDKPALIMLQNTGCVLRKFEIKMTEKLIECVRKYPSLYDTRNRGYKNVSEKARFWKIIGTEINEPGETARKKWKSLRDNYMRYKKEVAGTTGQAVKKFKKWPWAEHLQFLDTTLTERVRTSNVTLTRTEIPPETLPETSPMETGSTAMISVTPPTNPQPSEESLPVHSRAKKQKKDSSEFIEYMQKKKKPDYDAADNLFKSYAQTFKKLSLNNQVFVKLELAKLFADIELKDAEEKAQLTYSPIYSVKSSNSETQDSTITLSEIDPQIVFDSSNIKTTRTTQSEPNYNSTATQQQDTEQNTHIINYGASTSR